MFIIIKYSSLVQFISTSSVHSGLRAHVPQTSILWLIIAFIFIITTFFFYPMSAFCTSCLCHLMFASCCTKRHYRKSLMEYVCMHLQKKWINYKKIVLNDCHVGFGLCHNCNIFCCNIYQVKASCCLPDVAIPASFNKTEQSRGTGLPCGWGFHMCFPCELNLRNT